LDSSRVDPESIVWNRGLQKVILKRLKGTSDDPRRITNNSQGVAISAVHPRYRIEWSIQRRAS